MPFVRPVHLCLALLAASPAASAAPAPSGDWRVVVTDQEDDVGRVIGFADVGSESRAGNVVGFWLEFRLERPPDEADGYRGHVTADCAAFTYSSAGLMRLAGARVIEQGGSETGLTAGPGTNMRVVLEAVCARSYRSSRVDPVAYSSAQFGK